MMEKGYTQEKIFATLFESEQDRKRRRMQTVVTETVDTRRLRKMRDLLAFEKLATWRRMNGFDRVVDGEDNWIHARSLPSTPQEFSVSLRSEWQKLKDVISMPRQKVSNLINEIEEGKVGDEKFAVLKRLVEKRSRKTAQAQVTATPVDTVQHCSPCTQTPEPSLSVCVKLENNEVKMDPERGELESPLAGTSLETPGQQCPPNEGTWDRGRTTADGILTAGVGSNQGGTIFSPTERAKNTATFADISSPTEHFGAQAGTAATPAKRRHKTTSEENKQFDPGGKGEKTPPWNAAVTLPPFSGESWEAPCLCFVFSICALCVLCFLNYCSFQVTTSQRAEKHEGRRGLSRWCTQREGKHFLVYHPLEDGEDKQHPVWS